MADKRTRRPQAPVSRALATPFHDLPDRSDCAEERAEQAQGPAALS
jgi:hypothetical protein